MISVGSRDARKGMRLGLGFDSGGPVGDMEETELEEGEAFSLHNNDEYDESIDPDVALSYIDEKLQDVLGHFQKDFEGGVSAENLGAKFGGYGSFLPTYHHSPVCSHPRTPTKFQNQNSPRSLNNSQLEGGLRLSAVSSTTSQSVKLGPTSTSATSLPALPPLSLNDPSKQEVWVPSSRSTEDLAPQKESANKKSSKISDQKTLKVRLKVGSDNLSTQKNAEIYSGLGLDVSPSSSLDEIPSGSEGMSREEAPNESPTSILQIMTSFPVHGNLLLSPLPDDLLHLTENAKFAKDGRSMPVLKGAENSRVSVNGFESVKGDIKVIGVKKMKSVGKRGFSAELNKSVEDACYNVGLTSKKEIDFDSLSCEELVSNTLKLPMLTNEVGWFDKPKAELAEKVGEDKKVSPFNNVSVYPGKDGHRKEEKSSNSLKAESDVSKMKKAIYATLIDPPKQKVTQKWTNNDQDGVKLPAEKESSFLEGKRKSKGTHVRGNLAVEDPKESSRPGSSISKSKKNSHANGSTAKNELEDLKVQKDIMKARDAYKDFFGDSHLGEQDNQIDAFKTPEGKVRDSGVNEKNTSAINDALKERLSSRKFDKSSKLEAYPKAVSNIPPHSTSGPTPDGLLPLVGTQFIQENWVGCDKCQRWRLLPLGTNPEDLPDKWTCSMLNWLPKMNRCSVTEEETTKALLALYQVPTAENQNYMHNAGATPAGVWNQSNKNYGLHAVPGGGKKKHGLKEITNASNKNDPNLTRKSLSSSYKSTKLNDMNQSPLMNKSDSQQLSKSSDLPVEKQQYKHKENQKGAEQYSDGGDTRNLKMGSRRGTDQDCIRASKKVKTESMHSDEDWKFDHGGANGKVGTSSSNGFDATAAKKDQLKYSDCGSSKERYDTKDLSLVAAEKTEGANGSLDLANCDNRIIAPKKRKVKEGQDPEIHLDPSIGYDPEDRRNVQEEFSENDYRKEKKAKFSKSDGKGYDGGSHGNGRTGRKGNIGSTLSQRSLDGTDYGTRDLGSAQAATSSSSKISGSHKTKTSFQEVKGSPVESVSSSPMRLLDPDKLTSARRNLKEKYESQGTEFFSVGTPRKCSDGEEDGGSDRSETARKDKTFSITNKSMDSTIDFHDKNCSNLSGGKVKTKGVHSSDIANQHFTCGDVNDLCQDTQNPSKTTSDHHVEEKQKGTHYSGNEPRSRKSGKGSSRSKDKSRKEKHEDVSKSKSKSKSKLSGSVTDSQDAKLREGKNKFQEKPELKFDETEKRYIGKKDSSGELSGDNSKRSSVSSYGGRDGPDMKADVNFTQDPLSIPKQNLQNRDGERSTNRLLSEKNDQKDLASRKGRLLPLPPSGGGQNETLSRCPRPVSGTHKGNEADKLVIDASEVDDALKVQRQIRKADDQNGGQQVSLRHPTPCGNRLRDNDAPSPLRRESSSHAASSALKEAKDLKHRADRIKNTESDMERTTLYLEAVLKFLRASSLLESSNSENGKYGEMIQAMQIYSSTAKLCDFCAREYERQKNLAFAALAHKCTEVAYMRVIYSSHSNASRDRHELQTALQIVPPGESPSSSASDVDNLNLATADKVTAPKSVGSPQVAGNHIIAAKNRPNYLRLLNFTQDVHLAMEASRKSRNAFAAANTSLSDAKYKEGMTSIKRALDFNFQDLEGLLRLVKLAIEAFNP